MANYNYFSVVVLKDNEPKSGVKVKVYGEETVETNKYGVADLFVQADSRVSLYISGRAIVEDMFWSTFKKDKLNQQGQFIYRM